MKRRDKTFAAITRVLEDGSWHAIDDLRKATRWPDHWIAELEAEGVVETGEQVGNMLVRLRKPQPLMPRP